MKTCTAPAAGENDIKAVKNDLHSDRTSATTFLANATQLYERAGPMSYIMRSAPTRSLTRPWPRPTLHRDPHALQSGHAGQTIQGPDSLAPADLVPRQSAVTSGDDIAHSHPCPRLEHLLRASISPAACCSPPLDWTIRLGSNVWHRTRALLGRGAPGGRRIAVRTGPTETLRQILSRKKPSPSVYPDARLP